MPLTTLTKVKGKQLDTSAVALNRLSDIDLSTPPTTGQTLVWNGTKFVAGAGFTTSDFNIAFASKSTSHLTEGTRLYYTDARARLAVSAAGSINYDSVTGVFSFTQGNTDTVSEGTTNLYFTSSRARASLSASGAIGYNSTTGVFSFTQGNTDTVSEGTTNLYFTSSRARASLSASGAIGYNSTTGVFSFTQGNTDTVSEGTTNLYFTQARTRGAVSAGSNLTYNSTTGVFSLTSGNVTGALGFTPYNATNPSGYTTNTGTVTSVGGTGTVSGLTLSGTVTGSGNLTLGGTLSLTSSNVTTALGFTPYNATNPNGYTTNTGTVTSVSGTGTVSGLTLSGSVTSSGSLTLGGTLSLTSSNVTTALGYTPYNGATNPNGYVSTTLTVKDEGTSLTTAATSIDFVGSGVTATNTGSAVTVTINSSGGGGGGGTVSNALEFGVGLANDGDMLWYKQPSDLSAIGLGATTAVNATYTFVSALGYDNNRGAVFVYENTTGILKYRISGIGSYDAGFGTTLAVSGNYLAVSAPMYGSYVGRVYVFNMANWAAYTSTTINITTADVTLTNPASFGYFGSSVAINSSYIAVGSPRNNSGGYSDAGMVYVYDLTGSLKYTINDPTAFSYSSGDNFGSSLALGGPGGTTLVVGAPYESDATSSPSMTGKLYVFTITNIPLGGTVTSSNYTSYGYVINNPDSVTQSPRMGNTVAFNGTKIIAGAPSRYYTDASAVLDGEIKYDVGAVYVFDALNSGAFLYKIDTPNPISNQGQYFGNSVAVSGNDLLVGEPNSGIPIEGSGTAYLYDISSSTKPVLKKIYDNFNAIGRDFNDNFGTRVSIYGNYAAFGAPGEQSPNYLWTNAGIVYLVNTKRTFDGSATMSVGLAKMSVKPGMYGSGDTNNLNIPRIVVDKYGRINSIDTVPVSMPAQAQAFGSVSVNGASIYAMTPNDSLSLVAGSNVTITADPNSKTITISSTGSSGGSSGGGSSSPASRFKFLAGPTAVSFSSNMVHVTGPDASGRVFGTFGAYPYTVMGVMSPSTSFTQVVGSYSGSPGPNGLTYPWVSSTPGAGLSIDVQIDNWSNNSGTMGVQLYSLDPSTNPNSMTCYYCNTSSYSPDGSFPLSNAPGQQFGVYMNNPNFAYGVMVGNNGPMDMTNFIPAPGVTFYYNSTLMVGMFIAPPSVWASGGSLGSLPGFSGMFSTFGYYFGS